MNLSSVAGNATLQDALFSHYDIDYIITVVMLARLVFQKNFLLIFGNTKVEILMEFEAAKQKVYEFINNRFDSDDDELVICSEEIIKTDFGWVFPYDSKKFLETGELIYALPGNAPILFDNRDETIHITGTSRDAYYYIDLHQKNYIPNS